MSDLNWVKDITSIKKTRDGEFRVCGLQHADRGRHCVDLDDMGDDNGRFYFSSDKSDPKTTEEFWHSADCEGWEVILDDGEILSERSLGDVIWLHPESGLCFLQHSGYEPCLSRTFHWSKATIRRVEAKPEPTTTDLPWGDLVMADKRGAFFDVTAQTDGHIEISRRLAVKATNNSKSFVNASTSVFFHRGDNGDRYAIHAKIDTSDIQWFHEPSGLFWDGKQIRENDESTGLSIVPHDSKPSTREVRINLTSQGVTPPCGIEGADSYAAVYAALKKSGEGIIDPEKQEAYLKRDIESGALTMDEIRKLRGLETGGDEPSVPWDKVVEITESYVSFNTSLEDSQKQVVRDKFDVDGVKATSERCYAWDKGPDSTKSFYHRDNPGRYFLNPGWCENVVWFHAPTGYFLGGAGYLLNAKDFPHLKLRITTTNESEETMSVEPKVPMTEAEKTDAFVAMLRANRSKVSRRAGKAGRAVIYALALFGVTHLPIDVNWSATRVLDIEATDDDRIVFEDAGSRRVFVKDQGHWLDNYEPVLNSADKNWLRRVDAFRRTATEGEVLAHRYSRPWYWPTVSYSR